MESQKAHAAAPTMTKPILIDALHINMGGAYMILNHFINRLVANNISFVLLKDIRCKKLDKEDEVPNLLIMSPSLKSRKDYYKQHKDDFNCVLCLGNLPPPIKLNATVYTYIHNVSLLDIPASYPLKWKIAFYLKRLYIKHYSKNNDLWVVQTSHTANLVKKHLPCENKQVLIYPFFKITTISDNRPKRERNDYVFIGEHTYAKGHNYLIEAWSKLHHKGYTPTLHLTISNHLINKQIEKLRLDGVNIENHGHIPVDEVIKLYHKSKATVYPSLNESLGLGIIEAISAGCDVIGCDLPYMHSVCNPSCTFPSCNSDGIVDAVIKYENEECRPTKLLISDKADDLISLLITKNSIQQ